MKVKKFDRPICRAIKDDLAKDLEMLGDKYGIIIKTKSGSFSDETFTFKVECAVITKDGAVMTKEARDFQTHAFLYGLDKDLLWKEFKFRGNSYKITGLRTRARKTPIVCERNGKIYRVPAEIVTAYFGEKMPKIEVKKWGDK